MYGCRLARHLRRRGTCFSGSLADPHAETRKHQLIHRVVDRIGFHEDVANFRPSGTGLPWHLAASPVGGVSRLEEVQLWKSRWDVTNGMRQFLAIAG